MQWEWQDEDQTKQFAEALAKVVKQGDILCLEGDLGAGKTTFTRYFARALGINKNIKSPTFTIIREYQDGRLPLYHMDAYRLEETGAEGIGLEEYLEGDGICIIEWPNYIKEDIYGDYVWITIDKLGDTSRRVALVPHGERANSLITALGNELRG